MEKETVALNVDIPASLRKKLDEYVEKKGGKIKEEVASALWKHINNADEISENYIKLDDTPKEAIKIFAQKHNMTINAATNYLVQSKINVMEYVHDIITKDANKAYEAYIAGASEQKTIIENVI